MTEPQSSIYEANPNTRWGTPGLPPIVADIGVVVVRLPPQPSATSRSSM